MNSSVAPRMSFGGDQAIVSAPSEETPTARTRAIAAASLLLVVGAVTMARLWAQLDVAGAPERGGAALNDFRDAFYYPTIALFAGHNPYASEDYLRSFPVGFAFPLYSPSSLLLHAPFALLPYRVAQAAFVAFNFAMLLLLCRLSLRAIGRAPTAAAMMTCAAVLLITRPGQQNIINGQCTLYVAVGAYVALLYARSRPNWAAAGLALTSIKPTIALPLGFLMLCRGDWAVVWKGAAIGTLAAAVAMVPVLYVAGGIDGMAAAIQENLRLFRENPGVDAFVSRYRTDLAALAARLLWRPLSAVENVALAGGVLALTGVAIHRLARRDRHESMVIALISIALFVCTYHLPYDAVLLTASAIALALAPQTLGRIGTPPWRWLSLALLAGIAFNYFASEAAIERFALTGRWWWITTSATSVMAGALFLIWLVLAARPLTSAAAHSPQKPNRSELGGVA